MWIDKPWWIFWDLPKLAHLVKGSYASQIILAWPGDIWELHLYFNYGIFVSKCFYSDQSIIDLQAFNDLCMHVRIAHKAYY